MRLGVHDKIWWSLAAVTGDISVGGLPFRSAELTPGTPLFGGKTAMALYPGEWELRYVFEGFEWRPKGPQIE